MTSVGVRSSKGGVRARISNLYSRETESILPQILQLVNKKKVLRRQVSPSGDA